MKSKIQNSMDLLQNVYILKPFMDVYILEPHPNLTYLLISNVCNINSGIRTTLLFASRADSLVGCLTLQLGQV